MAYATTTDLASYLYVETSALDSACPRLLARADELVSYYAGANLNSSDADELAACKNAVCAQVEYWLTAGEDADLDGGIKQFSASKISITYADGGKNKLAPRAYRFLLKAGLLYSGAYTV